MILENTLEKIYSVEFRIQKKRRKQLMIRNMPGLSSIDDLLSANVERFRDGERKYIYINKQVCLKN
jgi:hypothetical protein